MKSSIVMAFAPTPLTASRVMLSPPIETTVLPDTNAIDTSVLKSVIP